MDPTTKLALTITAAVLLSIASALFSGLTLGLMTLDVVQLKILMAGENDTDPTVKAQAKYAKRIYPLRKDGNLLLVTLLIGNVAVNSAFSILTADLLTGILGFLVSTVVITAFGEIIPQAVCSRFGLVVGYYLAYLVWAIQILLYPIVKPIALLLDAILGEEIGSVYNKKQLKALVGHHHNEANILTREEAKILEGGLDIAHISVEAKMTPIDQVFTLDVDDNLDFDTIAEVVASGFSRVPVLNRTSETPVIGLIHVKDLALVDPNLNVSVRTLLHMYGREVFAVDSEENLLSLLAEFKKGRTHLAIVRKVVDEDDDKDPFYRHVGVISLEDILECILQDDIQDEYDEPRKMSVPLLDSVSHVQDTDDSEVTKAPPLTSIKTQIIADHSQPNSPGRGPRHAYLMSRNRVEHALTDNEAIALSLFLANSYPQFGNTYVNPSVLGELLKSLVILQHNSKVPLYNRDSKTDRTTVVLSGRVSVTTGDDNFESFVGAWTVLAPKALGPPPANIFSQSAPSSTKVAQFDESITKWHKQRYEEYVPDFSAETCEDATRIIQITRSDYISALKATYLGGPLDNNGKPSVRFSNPNLYTPQPRLAKINPQKVQAMEICEPSPQVQFQKETKHRSEPQRSAASDEIELCESNYITEQLNYNRNNYADAETSKKDNNTNKKINKNSNINEFENKTEKASDVRIEIN